MGVSAPGNHGGHGGGDCLQEEMDVSASAPVTVTVSHGGMVHLLRQLHSLKATSIEGVSENDLQTFKANLERLCTNLKKLAQEESPSFTAKGWMEEVRNLCYDTEDYLDKVTQSGADAGESALIKAYHRGKPKRQRQFAADFSELRARAKGAEERYTSLTRYSLPSQTIKGAPAELSVLENHEDIHKHTDSFMDNLVKLLDFDAQEQFKVVSILGFAGVGKTTLARSLYHKFGARFECRAFVQVSRNPDMRRFLISMLSQIKGERTHFSSDVHDLFANIKKHLQKKRYLIVIDALWSSTTWDIISRALPTDNGSSRIIITTQTEDVAMGCCSYNSTDVFKIIPSNYFQSSGEPFETTIMVANLLQRNLTGAQRGHLQISLLSSLRTNPTSEGMKELLDLIYGILPDHLKTCLLYFNMYPEDYTIKKNDLVKQWVAEGFISAVNGQETDKVAETYFDELICTGLIQPVDINYNNDVLSCTVHHIVLDFTRYKSKEENFISIADYFQTTPGNPDRIRRLSVQFGGAKGVNIPGKVRMSQLRSLVYFGFFKCVPSLVDYALLRVLTLHVWADKEKMSFDLSRIHELFRLRYLKIACNVSVKLPAKIRRLKHLETLDLDARVVGFPSDIVHLQHLLHLRLPRETNMPRGIDKMTSLRSFAYFQLSKDSKDNLLNLGKLTNLQDLHLTCSRVKNDRVAVNMDSLWSIMEKFSKLKSLILDADALPSKKNVDASAMSIPVDSLSIVSSPPPRLQKLEFSPKICIFPSLPVWIRKLSGLAILKIAVKDLQRNNIEILKRLTALTVLSLSVETTPAERVVFDEGFQALRYFKFTCTAPCLSFVEGAMVKVEMLKLCFNADSKEQYDPRSVGFEYLTSLKVISVKFGDTNYAESALEAAVIKHPGTPTVSVQSTEGISYGDNKNNESTQQINPHVASETQGQGIITGKDSDGVKKLVSTSTTTQQEHQTREKVHAIEEKGAHEQGDVQDNRTIKPSESSTPNTDEYIEERTIEEKHVTPEKQCVTTVVGGSNMKHRTDLGDGQADTRTSIQEESGLHVDDQDEVEKASEPKEEHCIPQKQNSMTSLPEESRLHLRNQDDEGIKEWEKEEECRIPKKEDVSAVVEGSNKTHRTYFGDEQADPRTSRSMPVESSLDLGGQDMKSPKPKGEHWIPQTQEITVVVEDSKTHGTGLQDEKVDIRTISPEKYSFHRYNRDRPLPRSSTNSQAVLWGVPWFLPRIITTFLNKELSYLGFDLSQNLKELETKVSQLELVLETVEESPHKYRLEELLQKLRSALCEAEDILDVVEYYRLKRQILLQPNDKFSRLIKQMSDAISSDAPTDISRWKLNFVQKTKGWKLNKILYDIKHNIDDAHKILLLLNLTSHSKDGKRQTVSTNSRSAVTTAAPPPVVIGRENDRNHIIDMLHENLGDRQSASDSALSYSIIGIHGIFGSGKSTLAQYICHYMETHGHFNLIMWVHVSQNFSVDDIFSKIIEEATGNPCPAFKSLNTLERKLVITLSGKRFLLVLDDVWYSKDDSLRKLQKIVSLLDFRNTGSKILVTSQTTDALIALGARRCIAIPDLNDSDFFKLFMHCALEGANIDKQERRKFEVIGADIAKKLRRSPLAARTVGAQLRIRPNISFWRYACDRYLLNETIGALWSSYQHLDEQLRRCFAYCSIFPRGYRLQRNDVINMWVAQGFIKTTDAAEDMEDVGERYFDELVSNSFLQPAEKPSGMLFDIEYFTVNDLLHVVAEKVAGSECFRIEDGWSGECPKDVCHLFVQTYVGAQIIEKISKLKNLRTLIIYTDRGDKLIEHNIFKRILLRLRKLRVLHVGSESYNNVLVPASIGQLKRLRYLSLRFSELTLPSTLSKLYHMQVLDFGTCGNIAFSSVEDVANLINLRHITLQPLADISFPNISRLTLLKTLPLYTVRKEQGYGIQQLEYLNKLRGSLQIRSLENVQSKEEAVKAMLADKGGLTHLALYWNDESCYREVQAEVLEGLCPPMNLAKLTIEGYHGQTYPKWMVEQKGPNDLGELELLRCRLRRPDHQLYNFFAHLRSLQLQQCSWDSLPDFMENLTELTNLIIDGCMNILFLPALPLSLNYFKLENCNDNFMTSCKKIGDPNWEKVQDIPDLIIGHEIIRSSHQSDNS